MEVPVDLKIRYLSRRAQDIQVIKHSLEKEDFSYAAKVGHQVKGNAATFDFPRMAPLGVQIEQAAQRMDKEKLQFLVSLMETEILRAEAQIKG